MSSLKRHDGVMITDHRAIHQGYSEVPTISCSHCGVAVVINPLRERERNYCRSCDHYICDICGAATKQPGYTHRSFREVADLVMSGKYTLSGSLSSPILIPTTTQRGHHG